jgi:hypothetical protein
MSASLVAWRRTAVAAFAAASLSGLSFDPANAQDASEEMQRAKAALSAALRDRVAAEQKRAETVAPTPSPAAAPAPVRRAPTAATVADAEADAAPAAARSKRRDVRERHARKAVAPARQTRIARHRPRTHLAAAEERAPAPRREAPDAASTATADFPATTGSLPAQPAGSLAAPTTPAAAPALPASLAPAVPSLGSNELSVYREGLGWMRGTQAALNAMQQPLTAARGARPEIVAACREAIVPAAVARGATEVYAAGTARARKGGAGRLAPIEVRILYKGMATTEVRQASITCELDREGRVVALTDTGAQPGSR